MRVATRGAMLLVVAALLTACSTPPAPTDSTPTDSTPTADPAVQVLPGEEWIAYQYGTPCGTTPSDPSTICLVRPDGTGRHPLAIDPGEALHPDWSPDGMQLTYTYAGSIWAAGVDGSDARELATCEESPCQSLDYPAWSPDGTQIAFTRYNGPSLAAGPPSSSAIETIEVDTGRRRVVTETQRLTLVDQARWSPDSSQLVMQIEHFSDRGVEIGGALGIVSAEGGPLTQITELSSFATYPDWGPADTIVFVTHEYDPAGGPIGLGTVSADGSDFAPLLYRGSDTQQSMHPSWTPDGSQIMFVQWDDRAATLIDPDGSNVTVLSGFRASHPRLRPIP